MKAPTTLLNRPGRTAAVVGAVVAVSATTLMALVAGTAAASEPGRCTDTVNIRATPDPTARIVGLCEAGTEVQVGETRNGFVRLTDRGGWSAQEYVAVNGAAPAAPSDRAPAAPGTAPDPDGPPAAGDSGGTGGTGDSGGTGGTGGTGDSGGTGGTGGTGGAGGDGSGAGTGDDATPPTTTRPAPRAGSGESGDEDSTPTARRIAPRQTTAPAPEPEPEPEAAPGVGGLLG